MNSENSTHHCWDLDGVPKMSQAIPLALQHVVAMIVGCVTPAISSFPVLPVSTPQTG